MIFNLAPNENKLYKTLDYWLRDKLNFHFLEQGLGNVSPPHFGYNFPWKMFLLTDQIWLFDWFYFLRYWTIYVFQFFVSQVVTL